MSGTYTVKQVAELLGYSTNSIYTFLKEGRINGIRVGQGRFRITEEELRRVLHLSKRPVDFKPEELTSKVETIVAVPGIDQVKISDLHFDITSLFDWFVGMSSIIIGFSLSLYNKYLVESYSIPSLTWIFPLQVSLIAGGIGLLISDVFQQKISPSWLRLFQAILLVVFLIMTIGKFQSGDGGGLAIYGLLTLLIGLHSLKLVKGMEAFLILISVQSLIIPLVAFFKPTALDFPQSLNFMLAKKELYISTWLVIVVITVGLLWWSHQRKRLVFWIIMVFYGVIFIGLSFSFVNVLAWGKAFLHLLIGLTCLLTPAWESLHLYNHKERKTILPILSAVILILVLVVSGIWLTEENAKEYAKKELVNKASYGKNLVETVFVNLQGSITSWGQNPTLGELVTKDDDKEMTAFLKLLYQGSRYIRRLLVLSESGTILSIYPHQVLTTTNVAFRDYFIKARSGEIFLSDGFEATVTDKRLVVVVAGPIYDKDKKIVGVLVASLDLPSLGNRLQQVASSRNGEYFILTDKKSIQIIHPDSAYLGKAIELKNFEKQEQFNYQGVLSLQAFEKLEKTGWLIGIQAPVTKILAPTRAVNVVLFLVVVLIVVSVGAVIIFVQMRKATS